MPRWASYLRLTAADPPPAPDRPADGWIVAADELDGVRPAWLAEAFPLILDLGTSPAPERLAAALPTEPQAILVRGVGSGIDLQRLDARIAVAEAELGWAAGRLAVWVEAGASAASVFQLGTLAGASPRLQALVWREAGLASALAVAPDARVVRHARALSVLAAAAAGVPALYEAGEEALDPETVDPASLRREGFAGVIAAG